MNHAWANPKLVQQIETLRTESKNDRSKFIQHALESLNEKLPSTQLFIGADHLIPDVSGNIQLRDGKSAPLAQVIDLYRRLEFLSLINKKALIKLFEIAQQPESKMPLRLADCCEDFGLCTTNIKAQYGEYNRFDRLVCRFDDFLLNAASVFDLSGNFSRSLDERYRKRHNEFRKDPEIKLEIDELTRSLICSAIEIDNRTIKLRSPQEQAV